MLKPGDYLAPTGKLIKCRTLDCDKGALERSLKFYDPQLYLKWNEKKRGGWGLWEVRRRPNEMSLVYQGELNDKPLFTMEYQEIDLVAHVLDLPYLHHDALGKIKSMDTWSNGSAKNFNRDLEYAEAKHREAAKQKNKEELRYNLKQHKREWREFADLVSQGVNPGAVLNGFRFK